MRLGAALARWWMVRLGDWGVSGGSVDLVSSYVCR